MVVNGMRHRNCYPFQYTFEYGDGDGMHAKSSDITSSRLMKSNGWPITPEHMVSCSANRERGKKSDRLEGYECDQRVWSIGGFDLAHIGHLYIISEREKMYEALEAGGSV